MYPHWHVVVPLAQCIHIAYKFEPSYVHKFPLSRSFFSNKYEYIISQELPPSNMIWEMSNYLALAMITTKKFIGDSSYRLWILEPHHRLVKGLYRCTSILFMDGQHLVNFSLHCPLGGRVFLRFSSNVGSNIQLFPFVGILAFIIGPDVCNIRGSFTFRPFFHLFWPFHVLGHLILINQPLNSVLQLDAVVDVMIMTFMKTVVLWLVSLRWLSNRIRRLDSSFLKFYVGILLVYLLTRSIQWNVLVVPSLHSMARLILTSVGLLPSWVVRFSLDRSRIIESCIQFFSWIM